MKAIRKSIVSLLLLLVPFFCLLFFFPSSLRGTTPISFTHRFSGITLFRFFEACLRPPSSAISYSEGIKKILFRRGIPFLKGSIDNNTGFSHIHSNEKQWNELTKSNRNLKESKPKPRCNYFEGKWVKVRVNSSKSNSTALYDGRHCSVIQSNWVCQKHQRPSFDYLNYKWKPHGCELPEFDPDDFLNRMRNKTIGFIGDSLSRQQFQSLVCLLSANDWKEKPVEVTRDFGFFQRAGSDQPNGFAYAFRKTNTTVLFIGNSFLCDLEGYKDEGGEHRVSMHLDRPDAVLVSLFDSMHVLVVANSHHFIPRRMHQKSHDYFLNGVKLSEEESNRMSIANATNIVLQSMASFLNSKVNNAHKEGKHPLVFFRTITLNHYFNGSWHNKGRCDHIHNVLDEKFVSNRMLRDMSVENAVENKNLILLNITGMCQYRGDAHPSSFDRGWFKGFQDCLHWCLPGVPDVWNQIMYSYIIS